MPRYIDADALKEKAHMIEIFDKQWVVDEIEIDMAPTIDVVPVVRGEWVYSRTQSEFAVSKCSNCGKEQFSISHVVAEGNYCPNCGAKMGSEGGT